MEFYNDIYMPFLEELLEYYRNQFFQEEEGRRLQMEQRKTTERMHQQLMNSDPELKEAVECYTSALIAANTYEQEQLYQQGVKDGIRIMKMIGALDE